MKRAAQETKEVAEAAAILAIPKEEDITYAPVARRRTEDEMRRALALILSGQPRARDDESVDILEDAMQEVFILRQIVYDLMQSTSTAHQQAIRSIQAMTRR